MPSLSDFSSVSPRSNNGMPPSPLMSSSYSAVINGNGEVHRLREEINSNKTKFLQWEERIAQARNVRYYCKVSLILF